MKNLIISASILFALSSAFIANAEVPPDCTGANNWPASMAQVYLKNAGLIQNEKIDFSKTQVKRLASEKIGSDLYRQVHQIKFVGIRGESTEVLTVNNASKDECSEDDVEVFLISKHLPNQLENNN